MSITYFGNRTSAFRSRANSSVSFFTSLRSRVELPNMMVDGWKCECEASAASAIAAITLTQ